MNRDYFVPIHVKPYVYRWLIKNFLVKVEGLKDAVSFKRNFELKSLLLALLSNKPYFAETHKKEVKNKHKNKVVYIYTGQNAYDHSACCLTYTAETLLANHLESMIKQDLINYVTFMYIVEPQLSALVERYKQMKGYSEDDWPTLSMLKIINRKNVKQIRDKAREHFLELSDKFYTTQVSNKYNRKKENG